MARPSRSAPCSDKISQGAGAPAAAATATGLASKHLAQLKAFLEDALA